MSPNDLTVFHMKLIENCDYLVGGARHLSFFPEHKGQTLTITKDLSGLVETLKSLAGTFKIVVLASGDPLFYGIGATLSEKIPKKWLRIHPNICSVAAAFSKIGQSWHDALILSLHSSPLTGFNFAELQSHSKIALLTSPDRGPDYIARQLQSVGLTGYEICVLENIGHPEREKIFWFNTWEALGAGQYANPNIVVLIQRPDNATKNPERDHVSHETHFGMPDSFFNHQHGLITKSEIRVLSLSKLELTTKEHVMWDIGSGSGSVGLEAALLLPQGKVFAFEKNKDRLKDIGKNKKKLGLTNFLEIQTNFPEGLDNISGPDRIFIGGGGKTLDNIISYSVRHLKPGGIIVVNTVVIENMVAAMKSLTELEMNPEMIQVQISRSSTIANGHRLSPINPVWIITGKKTI